MIASAAVELPYGAGYREWEKFAAFSDMFELERFCKILADSASAVQKGLSVDLTYTTGGHSYLIERLQVQDNKCREILEIERPGLYPRTWEAQLFSRLYVILDEVTDKPSLLPHELPGLQLDFHKVLIAAHDVFEPGRRAKLIALVEKATLKNAVSRIQADKAKRPRQRGTAPGGGKAFVAAVKKESKKQKAYTALAWLKNNIDLVFDGFDVVSCDDKVVKFKYMKKQKPTISVDTFRRYWQLPDKST